MSIVIIMSSKNTRAYINLFVFFIFIRDYYYGIAHAVFTTQLRHRYTGFGFLKDLKYLAF